jgi:hypothetical protein
VGLDDVWRLLYRHPIIKAALEIIDDEVFGSGLDTWYNDSPAAEPLAAYVKQTMLPFLRDVLHTIIVQGVAPVKIDERGDMAVPYVPEPGAYQISLRSEHYRSVYELHPLDTFSGAKDPKVFFLEYYKPLRGFVTCRRSLSPARAGCCAHSHLHYLPCYAQRHPDVAARLPARVRVARFAALRRNVLAHLGRFAPPP